MFSQWVWEPSVWNQTRWLDPTSTYNRITLGVMMRLDWEAWSEKERCIRRLYINPGIVVVVLEVFKVWIYSYFERRVKRTVLNWDVWRRGFEDDSVDFWLQWLERCSFHFPKWASGDTSWSEWGWIRISISHCLSLKAGAWYQLLSWVENYLLNSWINLFWLL